MLEYVLPGHVGLESVITQVQRARWRGGGVMSGEL